MHCTIEYSAEKSKAMSGIRQGAGRLLTYSVPNLAHEREIFSENNLSSVTNHKNRYRRFSPNTT
jgi:hypothetical protein